MKVIEARNVDYAFIIGLELMYHRGVKRDSRNGPVYMVPEPVATVYRKPDERVLSHQWRDANPFFHLMEGLWMLTGSNSIAPIARIVKRMATFSDDGVTQNAAYGHRWRQATTAQEGWGGPAIGWVDQLLVIIDGLRKNHDCRRQVLQIWDHTRDLGTPTKDAACNVAATFQINNGKLDMSVFCRSNDIIWGCYGANAVHFSMLMEYIARFVGVPMGEYTQISVNWHAYEELYLKMLSLKPQRATYFGKTESAYDEKYSVDVGIYKNNEEKVSPFPLVNEADQKRWDLDCKVFVERAARGEARICRGDYRDTFFRDVAVPLFSGYDIYREILERKKNREVGIDWGPIYAELNQCVASDWRLACTQWIDRRRMGE